MNVTQRLGYYTPKKLTVDQAVKEKMKVLKEFCIVNKTNEKDIEYELRKAITDQPGRDYELVLDQVARIIISRKMSSL